MKSVIRTDDPSGRGGFVEVFDDCSDKLALLEVSLHRQHLVMIASAEPSPGTVWIGLFDDDAMFPAEQLSPITDGQSVLWVVFQFMKPFHSRLNCLIVDELVLPTGGGGSLSRTEAEAVHVEIADSSGHVERSLEVLLRLAGKSANDISRDGWRQTIERECLLRHLNHPQIVG